VQTKPHRRFMETEPFSSLNRPPIKFNSFIRYLFLPQLIRDAALDGF
jgi:hypothetical protein